MNQEDLARINQGNTSKVILDRLSPRLEKQRVMIIDTMKGEYLSGQMTEARAFAHIASLIALDNLEMDMKQEVIAGERIAMENNDVERST